MSNLPQFTGNTDQQALAEQVFKIMTVQGSFFAMDAPIRQTLENLADFFAQQRKADRNKIAREIDEALRANQDIFMREEQEDSVVYVVSRTGSYQPRQEDTVHTFKQRLYEPETPLPIDDISVVVTTSRPALTTVEPVFISDYWQQQAGLKAPSPSRPLEVEPPSLDGIDEPIVGEVIPEAVETAQPPSVEEVVEPVVGNNTLIALPNGVQIDLRRPVADLMAQYGPTLITQFRNALENDALRRIVVFGNDAFPEGAVESFGKNDLRRIRDYLLEVGEPLLDTQIIADVFYHNPRHPTYESFRFALNYRLSREKDFEFVGVEGARLWSAKGLPPIGTKRVKASEMGQLSGYLEEGFDDSLVDQSAESIRRGGSLSHILTFFEWEYGILPFSKAMAALLPAPLLPEQRTSVLRFEAPQHYTSTLTELRYPTGNRGGWLQGLEDFFHEHLVPGAMITLSRTDIPHVFTITYEEQAETSDRLLILEEKKNKFAFANVNYYAAVDSDMLLNQQRFGRLRNLKPLPMGERRKAEQVLEHVFQTVGEPLGTRMDPRYHASFDDLYIAFNVLRPTSRDYLRHLLNEGDFFSVDAAAPDAWYYTPPPEPEEEDEGDEDILDDEEE